MRFWIFLFLTCLPSFAQELPVWARDPMNQPPSMLWAAAASLDPENRLATHEILCKVEVRIEDDFRVSCRTVRVFRVLDRFGLTQEAELSATWSPVFEQRPSLRALVLNGPTQKATLDAETIREESGCHPIVTVKLPDLKIGSLVVTEVLTKEFQAPFPGSAGGRLQLFPARWLSVAVETPINSGFKSWVRHLTAAPVATLPEDRERHLFTAFETDWHLDTQRHQRNTPQVKGLWPDLQFGTAPSWNSLAKQYNDRVEALLATDLPKPPADLFVPDEPAKTCYNLSQWLETRIQVTCSDDGTFAPQDLATTLASGKGRIIDRALALVACLRAHGIEAKLAFLNRQMRDVEKTLPNMRLFDGYLVRFDGGRWCDPMKPSLFDPPYYDLKAPFLLIDPQTQVLDFLGYMADDDEHLVMTLDQDLRRFGQEVQTLRFIAKGEFNRIMRNDFRGKSMQERVQALDLLSPKMDSAQIDNGDISRTSFEIATRYNPQPLPKVADLRISLSPYEAFARLLTFIPEEVFHIKDHTFLIHERMDILLPPQYEVDQRLANERFTMGALLVDVSFHYEPGRILVWLNACLDNPEASLAEIHESAVNLGNLEDRIVIAPSVMLRMERGEVVQAIADLKQQLEDPMKGSWARIQLAFAYERLGLKELAFATLPQGEQTPAALRSTIALAEFRRSQGAWPRSQCIAAYRTLMDQRDGSREDALLGIATALSYDSDGKRFVPGSDLERALEYLTEIPKSELNLTLLTAMGRFDQLLSLLPAQSDATMAFQIIAHLGLDHLDTVKELFQSATPEQGLESFAKTIQLANDTRQYALYATLIDLAKSIWPELDDETVAVAKAGQPDPSGPNAPKSLLQRWYQYVWDPTSQPLEGVLEPGRVEAARTSCEAQREEIMAFMRSSNLNQEKGWLFTAISVNSHTIEGRPEIGFRCPSTYMDTLYLAPIHGRLYFVGGIGQLDLLGHYVWSLLEQGELAAACTWLDWIRDDSIERNVTDVFLDLWPQSGDRDLAAAQLAAQILIATGNGEPLKPLQKAYAMATGVRRKSLASLILSAQNSREQDTQMVLDYFRNDSRWDQPCTYLIKHFRALGMDDCLADMSEQLAFYRQRNLFGYALDFDDFPLQIEALRALENEGTATDGAYNQVLWRALFQPKRPEEVFELAQKLNPEDDYNRAHTLASFLAGEGKFLEALDLLRGQESAAHWTPRTLDWLVLGQIAKGLGEVEIARDYFNKIPAEDSDNPDTTYKLAQSYLKQLPQVP